MKTIERIFEMIGRIGHLQDISEGWLTAEVVGWTNLACKWHVGRKDQGAKSAGGKAWLDRWHSVSAEWKLQERGDVSWEYGSDLSGIWWHELTVVWRLKSLWVVWPKIKFGHSYFSLLVGHQKFDQGSAISIGLLLSQSVLKDRWNSCLDTEEGNSSFNGHCTDPFKTGVDADIPLHGFVLGDHIYWHHWDNSGGPKRSQSPHWRIVKQKLPDCSKNVAKTLIPPQQWKQRRDFLPVGFAKSPQNAFRWTLSLWSS